MAVTLKDIAARVGVTPVVVSRVLHNKASGIRVSAATAQRIREVADEMGYRVNVWARNFRNRQSMTLGILHGTRFPRNLFHVGSRYFCAVMDGIVEGSFKHGYSVTLCPELMGEDTDTMNDSRFDGLLWLSTSPIPEMRKMLIQSQIPLVILHHRSTDFDNHIPTILCDNRQGIRFGLEHLVELGHRRIGFSWRSYVPTCDSVPRRDAFLEIASEMKLPVTEADIIDVGRERIEIDAYLSNGIRHTALLCNTDALAGDFINAAPKYGIQIPRDLSIVGFDSTTFCNELRPALSSINQPLVQMGCIAAETLIRKINGEEIEPIETMLACGFDIRESTGPAREFAR